MARFRTNKRTGETQVMQDGQWVATDIPADSPAIEQARSTFGPVLVGAGQTFSNLGAGVQQMMPWTDQAALASEMQGEQAAMSPLEQLAPGKVAMGRALPYVATAPVSIRSLPGQMATAAGFGGAEYGSPAERAVGAVTGGVLGAAGYGANLVLNRVTNAITGAGSDIAQRATQAGMKMSPAQQTGYKTLQQLEAGIESLPGGALITGKAKAHNQRVYNSLVRERIGLEPGDTINPQDLGKAADQIGSVFDEVTTFADDVPLDDAMLIRMMDEISPDSERQINKWIRNYPDINDGHIASKDLVNLRNKVAERTRNAYKKGDYDLGDDLSLFQDTLEDGVARVAPADYAQRLAQARQQWKTLKAVEGGKTVRDGNVSPALMDTRLRTVDKGGYLRGRDTSPLYEATRLAESTRDMIGDSGTATRQFLTGLGIAGAAGGGGYTGQAEGALSAAALPYAMAGMYRGGPAGIRLLGQMSPALARTIAGTGLLADDLE